MTNDAILTRLSGIDTLPTFPRIVREMVRVIDDPASSASDLARHMDPSMVGEVLRVANKAYFGTRNFRGIVSLEHAIAVIGFEHLSEIILHMPFLSVATDDAFDRGKYISHSVMSGALSKALSAATEVGNPDEAYISGIMHDVGAIIIYRYFKDEWREIVSLVSSGMSRVKAEETVLSVDHGYVGASLLDFWSTPQVITESVRFHHRPDEAGENRDHAVIIHLASELAKGIDLREDLATFDDFAAKHRTSVESAAAHARNLPPSEEVAFLESIYDLLKEAKSYVEAVTEGGYDKSSCC